MKREVEKERGPAIQTETHSQAEQESGNGSRISSWFPYNSSRLHAPWEVFLYPRVGLPLLQTTFLKDAEMVSATIYAGGIGHFKDWFGWFGEPIGGSTLRR